MLLVTTIWVLAFAGASLLVALVLQILSAPPARQLVRREERLRLERQGALVRQRLEDRRVWRGAMPLARAA